MMEFAFPKLFGKKMKPKTNNYFLQGWYAREFGIPLIKNPWIEKISQSKHTEWNRGWIQANQHLFGNLL